MVAGLVGGEVGGCNLAAVDGVDSMDAMELCELVELAEKPLQQAAECCLIHEAAER